MDLSRTLRRFAITASCVALLGTFGGDPARGQYNEQPRSNDEDDNSALAGMLLVGGAVAAATPIWAPIAATGDDYSETGYFSEYPYKHGMDGNLMIGHMPTEPYDWLFQAKSAYADNFGRFSRVDTTLQIEGAHRFGIDAEFDYWRDSLIPGQTNEFWTGDANLLFRFAQSNWLQTRVGLGGAWLEDGANSDYGFNFTYKADLFIRDPLILSGELDWGTLGDETLFHPRITLGAQWHRAELFVGFDYFDIGPTQATSMLAGGRFWY